MGREKSKRHQRVVARKTIKAGEVNGVIVQSEDGRKLYLMRQDTEAGPTTAITIGSPYETTNVVRLSDTAVRGLVTALGKLLRR